MITIGQTVWLRDENRRHYIEGHHGPVYRRYFTPFQVYGETAASWLLSPGAWKVNKKTRMLRSQNRDGSFYGMDPHVYASAEEVDDACYVHEQRYELSRRVLDCKKASVLRQIDGLLQ